GVECGVAQLDQVAPTILRCLGLPWSAPHARALEWSAALHDPAARRGAADGRALVSVGITGIDEPEDVRPRHMFAKDEWELFVDADEKGQESYRLFKMDEAKGHRKKDPRDYPDVVKRMVAGRQEDFEQRKKERERHAQVATRRRCLIEWPWKLIV